MKKVLSILATTAMAFSFLGANVAQSCGCGCKCGESGALKQPCACQSHTPSQCKCGCPVSKDDFAKVLAERDAALHAELGLSKAQQDKAKAISDAKFNAMKPIFAEVRAKKQALNDIEESSFSLTQIKSKRAQSKALRGELSALKVQRKAISEKYNAEFEAILTDAQKAKWVEIQPKYGHSHGKKHHKHSGCGLG